MLNQNPMSVMTQASKLSIAQLQQAIKNGTVPPYIGVPLLQQKIKESQQAKQAMAAQQPQQPPIAQQVMQQAESQGVDTLPSNLPVQGMAGGGIIAFDRGGEVPRFDGTTNGSLVGSEVGGAFTVAKAPEDLAFQKQIAAQFQQVKADFDAGRIPKQTYLDRASALNNQLKSRVAAPESMYERSNRILNERQQGQTDAITKARIGDDSLNSIFPSRANYQAKQLPSLKEKAPVLGIPAAAAQVAAQVDGNKPVYNEADYNLGGGRESASVSTKSMPGIDALIAKGYEIKPYDDKELQNILASELNPVTKQPYTYEEIADRNKKQATDAGIDADMYKTQREELKDLKAKYKKGTKLDEAMPFFAFAEQVSKPTKPGEAPPSFIGSLASGLGAYGRTSAELTDKQEAKLEKIRSEGNALALATNAFNQATYTGNKADLKDAKNSEKTARMNLANLGIKTTDQQNEVAKEIFKAQVDLLKTDIEQTGANARYGKEDAMIAKVAQQVHKAHPELAPDEVSKLAYQIVKFQGGMYGADQRADQGLIKGYGDYEKNYAKQNPFPTSRSPKKLSYEEWAMSIGKGGAGSATPAADPYAGFSQITS